MGWSAERVVLTLLAGVSLVRAHPQFDVLNDGAEPLFRLLHNPDDDDRAGTTLAVGVVSAIGNFERRLAIRDTWFRLYSDVHSHHTSDSMPVVRYRFFIGLDTKGQIPPDVQAESSEFGDIAIVNCTDTYDHLVNKVIALFRWGARICGAWLVVRANDDVYLDLEPIVTHIMTNGYAPVGIYAGHFIRVKNNVPDFFPFHDPYRLNFAQGTTPTSSRWTWQKKSPSWQASRGHRIDTFLTTCSLV